VPNKGDGHRQVHVAIAANPHDLDVVEMAFRGIGAAGGIIRQDRTHLLLPDEGAYQILRCGPQQDVQLDVPARVKGWQVVAQCEL
jgi:hypothetical protein